MIKNKPDELSPSQVEILNILEDLGYDCAWDGAPAPYAVSAFLCIPCVMNLDLLFAYGSMFNWRINVYRANIDPFIGIQIAIRRDVK